MSTLQKCSVAGLEELANRGDIRRDLHVFVRDADAKTIKRAHRDNSLPKSVSMRLAKNMSIPDLALNVQEHGGSSWINYVDELALKMGFVQYDTKGQYAGWSSSEPSFQDNYVEVDKDRHAKFLAASLAEQEGAIQNALINSFSYSENEFMMHASPLSWLDAFGSFGCATGILPKINFADARRRLLKILAASEPGVWQSAAALIAWMKANAPHFLIPAGLRKGHFYSNFRESPRGEYSRESIKEDDPLGFEKVEGRFIERFLEGIPLALGYVETAYAKAQLKSPVAPSMGALKAFRVTQLGHTALTGAIPEAELTILPNHEVHVASLFHAERVHRTLATIAKLQTFGPHSVYKLNQRMVTEAASTGVSALKELSALTSQIPANIETELRNWEDRGDVCTIYGGFTLAEGPDIHRLVADGATAIADGLVMTTSADQCYRQLELMECVPQRVTHATEALKTLDHKAVSRFAGRQKAAAPAREEEQATIYRSMQISLRFGNAKLFDAFCNALLEAQLAVALDRKKLTATFSGSQEAAVQTALDRVVKKHKAKLLNL